MKVKMNTIEEIQHEWCNEEDRRTGARLWGYVAAGASAFMALFIISYPQVVLAILVVWAVWFFAAPEFAVQRLYDTTMPDSLLQKIAESAKVHEEAKCWLAIKLKEKGFVTVHDINEMIYIESMIETKEKKCEIP